MKPDITITLSNAQAKAVLKRLQKPNKIDDWEIPLRNARYIITVALNAKEKKQ